MNRFRCYTVLFFFSIIFLHFQALFSHEFLYPVAYTEHDGCAGVYVLYQKSITHLELWLWNPKTKVATKGLLSTYTPAGLRILPSSKGFSFIDEGRIRIKEFHKRSPKVINIYESIYDMHEIEWINEDNFYFSAKKNGRFRIFQMDVNGVIECLVGDIANDCMYPQIVGDHLFYIERYVEDGQLKREHVSYKVFKTKYSKPHLFDDKFKYQYNASQNSDAQDQIRKSLLNGDIALDDEDVTCENASTTKKECIADFKDSPISFLKMISDSEGFFLSHPKEVERQDKVLTFDCYHIKRTDQTWDYKDIFSFSIPTYLLLDMLDSRLYESILPLLPKYNNGSIYYVDYYPEKRGNINIFRYDTKSGITEQKSFGRHGQLSFSPIFTNNKIFFGGCVNESCAHSPKMWINQEGFVCIELPSILT